MSQRTEGTKGFWIWIGALIFALLLYGLPVNFKNALSSFVRDGLYYPFAAISTNYNLMKNNLLRQILLEKELAGARMELEQLREIRMENQRLRILLDFKERSEYSLMLAEVVGHGGLRHPSALVIAAGTNKGVRKDAPALTADGIVGKVSSIGRRTSIVKPLLDPSLRVAAIDQRSRTVGIVGTKNGRELIMKQVPTGEDIAEGDRIVTSGLGGVFPKGLIIGHVISVFNPPEGMFKKIVIQPAAEFGKLEEIFVLMNTEIDSIQI